MKIRPNAVIDCIQGMLPGLFGPPATPRSKVVQPRPSRAQSDNAGRPTVYSRAKVLSVRQPWAWLIVNGYKDVENRTWSTDHRGLLLIHAGQSLAPGYRDIVDALRDAGLDVPATLDRGGIVGSVGLVNVITKRRNRRDDWFEGPYGFVLSDAQTLPFMPMKGQLGLFVADYQAPGE